MQPNAQKQSDSRFMHAPKNTQTHSRTPQIFSSVKCVISVNCVIFQLHVAMLATLVRPRPHSTETTSKRNHHSTAPAIRPINPCRCRSYQPSTNNRSQPIRLWALDLGLWTNYVVKELPNSTTSPSHVMCPGNTIVKKWRFNVRARTGVW